MVWSLQNLGALTDAEFDRWRALLEARAGMSLNDSQRVFLQTQLAMRLRELNLGSYGQYYERVAESSVPARVEWQLFVDQLMVKETRFFRHPASVDFAATRLRRHLRHQPKVPFDVWSVGCSTGEEPYSLAMALADVYQVMGEELRFGITATDISRAALAVAKAGLYSERKLDAVPWAQRRRYFSKQGDGRYRIDLDLAERICFSQGNILDVSSMPALPVDLIYCQNLLIYFRKDLRERVLNAFAERLKPGGALVIGLGEVVDWSHPKLSRVPSEAVQAYLHE